MSGQITPFLLVALVILLIAAISVIQVGKVSIDKTCSANGADAGSLAAASNWAASLNKLAYSNYDLRSNYDNYRWLYKENLLPIANYYLAMASLYSAAASLLSSVGALEIFITLPVPPVPCVPFVWHSISGAAFLGASWLANEGSKAMQAYKIYVDYMKTVTIAFHDDQWNRYCKIRADMHDSYVAAKKEGFRYAFSNSCISSKLSKKQVDEFNNWLDKDEAYNEDLNSSGKGAKYSWEDKNGQSHEVSVTLTLPDIKTYTIRHTWFNFAQTQVKDQERSDLAAKVITILNIQTLALSTMGFTSFGIFISTSIGALLCLTGFGAAASAVINAAAKVAEITQYVAIVVIIASWIATTTGVISVVQLMLKNALADQSWEYSDTDGTPYLQTSEDYKDDEGLMIVSIEAINMENNSWQTTCQTTQVHPGIDVGSGQIKDVTTASSSTSKFSGGSMELIPQEVEENSLSEQILADLQNVLDVIQTFKTMLPWEAHEAPVEVEEPKTPEELEAIVEGAVNANYAPEIVDTN
ncbi:MAG: pilus assembly protein TadG-related protein [Candidatus Omnitrophica bacterium]|nr:pilus assembly protein TadG-related protein [Candidatus Omnitrophota bacterium]